MEDVNFCMIIVSKHFWEKSFSSYERKQRIKSFITGSDMWEWKLHTAYAFVSNKTRLIVQVGRTVAVKDF